MSFENGIFIPGDSPAISNSSDPSIDTSGSGVRRGISGSGGGNHRSGGRNIRRGSNTNPQAYHQKPRGDRQRGRGGENRNNDGVGLVGAGTYQRTNNDAPNLMQITGLGEISDAHFNPSYGELNPEAPTFQPRNFNINPPSFDRNGSMFNQQRPSEISRSSRGGRAQQSFQGSSSNSSTVEALPVAYDSYDLGQLRNKVSREPLGKRQKEFQRFSSNEPDNGGSAVSYQRSPRKVPHQPYVERPYRGAQEAGSNEGEPEPISNGYEGLEPGSNYQRFPKTTAVSRSSKEQTRSSSSNYRQPSKSNNWRSQPESSREYMGHIDTWEGNESESRKYKDQGSAGYAAQSSTDATKENVGQGMLFEALQVQSGQWKSEIFDKKRKPDPRNQRETLTDQLSRNAYDCMICVEKVRRSQPIWSCQKCYNVFHLNCLRKWANSSADEVGWRCPGCQTYSEIIPSEYMCFCGAMKNPQGTRSDAPHSCGQTCGRNGVGGIDCIHSCTIQCHPGPCPQCEALLTRPCCCGKTNAQVKCSSKAVLTCGGTCDKMLNCGIHKCDRLCHGGSCDPCSVVIKLVCYCGSEPKEVLCTPEWAFNKNYSCGKSCGKPLNCKRHNCDDKCHPGLCKPCKMSPEAVLSCPCGQTPITEVCLKNKLPIRSSCLDPIPTCGKACKKILPCGKPGDSHICQAECHLDPNCPTCPLVTPVKCRCGNKKFEIPCQKFKSTDDVFCEKKCTKKRNCGRHKCNTKCCIDHDHICPIVCDRRLRCGNHNCTNLCHNGHCPACRTVSFDELACECGATIIYPPVPCGTKPAQCHQPCSRIHECEHPVLHTCHSDSTCPPCTVLMPKWCNGNHNLRKNVMCHVKQVSCGMPCNKVLPCGRHKCVRFCHAGECQTGGEICKLPCEARRKDCGHNCGAQCHDGLCPEIKCKLATEVTCDCGRKKETMVCWKREKEYDRLVFYLSGKELKRLAERKPNEDGEVGPDEQPEKDENGILRSVKNKTPKTNILECDKECARIERNRKMVEALQLEDPDVTSTFGTPNYTDFLVSFAKKNPQFVEMVHQRLTSLVLKARKSKRKNETYGFESMNRDKRHFVHEYSDHFGCLSESFDEEPNRNVICTASKEKSYCPSVNLIDAVFRPNLKSERKNAYDDVEVFQNSKSQIMRPANGKIMLPSPRAGSGMVALGGPSSTPAWQPSGDFPPLS